LAKDALPTSRNRADTWSRESLIAAGFVALSFALAIGVSRLTAGLAFAVMAFITLVICVAGAWRATLWVREKRAARKTDGRDLTQDLNMVRALRAEHLGRLAHLSHEIRTPLNSMLALSELLRDGMAGGLNAEQKKYVDVIERNGQILIRMVSDVLDLARMEAGRITVELRSLDLADQLRATTAALAPLAEVKAISLAVDPMVELLPLVECDPERLRQVLTNLIGNAVKFTDRGRVVVSAELRRNQVAVHVADTGIGISELARTRLFEEFFQAGDTERHRNGGVGLGLAIASRLVRLMGGELSVESAEGVGSQFTFTLPIGDRAADHGGRHAGAPNVEPSSHESAVSGPSRDEHHGSHTPD
jgi:signal transduction histidine kinase